MTRALGDITAAQRHVLIGGVLPGADSLPVPPGNMLVEIL